MSADQQSDHEREAKDELERGPEHGHESDEVEAALDVLEIGGLEGGDLGLFLGEGADETGAGEVLLGFGGDVGEHGLDALEALMNLAAKILNHDADHGQRQECVKRKAMADVQHENQGESREHNCVSCVHKTRAQQHAHGIQIIRGLCHDVARACALIKAVGKTFEVAEHIVAKVEFNLAGGAD